MRTRAESRAEPSRPLLDIDALGLALLVALSLAWLTAVPYLLVRAGVGLPVRLVVIDGIHCYVGLAMAVFLVAKVRRAGRPRAVPAVPEVSLWDRWVALAMAITYSAVLMTGLAVLLPVGVDVRSTVVNAHLLATVWAAVPTTWHVVTHRNRLRGAATRLRQRLGLGGVARALVVVAFAVPLVVYGRAVAPLTQEHSGLSWQRSGPQVFLDRLEAAPNGRMLVAGGEGLFISEDGRQWRAVGNFGAINSRTLILGLRVTDHAIYVGTSMGLYAAPSAQGPYRLLPSPAREVHGIEVDPGNPDIVWVAAYNGVWRSLDGGAHWTSENNGLAQTTGPWALRFFHGSLFVSEPSSVDRWNGVRWVLSNVQANVNALDLSMDGSRLMASSMGQGIAVFDGAHWQIANAGLAEHAHDGLTGVHVDSTTDVGGGTVYAGTMINGIAESRDGAQTWSSVWPSLRGDVWRVRTFGGQLIAATDFGLLTYGPVPAAPAAVVLWWLYLLTAALVAGAIGVDAARHRRTAPFVRKEVARQTATMRRS